MLVLKSIVKSYVVAGQPFPALRGVDLSFRNNEFVSIFRTVWMWENDHDEYYWWFRSLYVW